MKQTASIISTYTADVSGVCSALYELGGMTVIHDASGCNSTYNTHDEPRWYDMDSLVFISALSEMEAVMGDDEKLVSDIAEAARETQPRFIAVAGTPIPMLVGTDFAAIAALCEERTGLPCFGFATNGTHSYVSGASMAFDAFASRFVREGEKSKTPAVNLLGATPLDFSVNGSVESMKKFLTDGGFAVCSCWAMGSTLEEIENTAQATVNLVVSASGLAAAKTLQERFGTPYVVGVPVGGRFSETLLQALRQAERTGESGVAYAGGADVSSAETVLIGEAVQLASLAAAIEAETGKRARVLCPVEAPDELLRHGDVRATDEDELVPLLKNAKTVIADPLYQPICPKNASFIPLPHEAFSGRIYRRDIPDITKSTKFILGEMKK